MTLNFGQYRGQNIALCTDEPYLVWVFGNVNRSDIDYDALADRILEFYIPEYNKEYMLKNRHEVFLDYQDLQDELIEQSEWWWSRPDQDRS